MDKVANVVTEQVNVLKINDAGDADQNKDDDFVDPWNVVGSSDAGIDYDKLIGKLVGFILLQVD